MSHIDSILLCPKYGILQRLTLFTINNIEQCTDKNIFLTITYYTKLKVYPLWIIK